MEQDAPGEDGCEAGCQRRAEDVRVVDAAKDLNDGGVQEIVERWMDEGDVSERHLPQTEAVAAIEEVADVPESGDAGVLPEGEGGGGEKKRGSGESVAAAACRGCVHLAILLNVWGLQLEAGAASRIIGAGARPSCAVREQDIVTGDGSLLRPCRGFKIRIPLAAFRDDPDIIGPHNSEVSAVTLR